MSDYAHRLVILERESVEEAYRQHAVLLFSNWLKEGAGPPERMLRGLHKAREAYIAAMTAIEERSEE